MSSRIPFIKPEFPHIEEITEDLQRIYDNNYYSNNGPIYYKFIEEMAAYLGQNLHVVALNNATSALMLAMKACFKPGKKYVALPAFTFPAGPLATQWCGYTPLFFDIDKETLQPSLTSIKEAYTEHGQDIAGILLINEYGIGNEQIDEWESLAQELSMPLIIDSAPGIGSTYPDGKLLGARGDCEIFSMHATKPFGIGEGGLIATKNKTLVDRIESLKNFGFDDHKLTHIEGLNAKITELDCAIGLRLLKNYENILTRRRNVYVTYERLLKGKVKFIPFAERASIQFATILVNKDKRDKVLAELEKHKIDARTYYAPPLQYHPLFKDAPKTDLKNTEEISQQVISLPVHNDMTAKTVEFICEVVVGAIHG